MRVFLTRHADAGDRDRWRGDDRERPLSEKGWAQARGLVRLLASEAVDTIISSPYRRCVETVEPLARARGQVVGPEPALQEGADPRVALRQIVEAAVPTVMCSQGDVIGWLVQGLAARGLVGPEARWQKGSTWVLDTEDGQVVAARYLAPLQV